MARTGRPPRPLAERFWAKVDRITTPDGCWTWTAYRDKDGYGTIGVERGHPPENKAHRVAWFLATGTWPTQQVLHSCDNPPCVRFEHLFEGTNIDNVNDKVQKARQSRGERSNLTDLTGEDVRAIRTARAAGMELAELAAKYKVTMSTISRISRGVGWKHVD